jgi:hypothetical protein
LKRVVTATVLFGFLILLIVSVLSVPVNGASQGKNCNVRLSISGGGSVDVKVNGYPQYFANEVDIPSGNVLTFAADPWYPGHTFNHFHVLMANSSYDDTSNPLTITVTDNLQIISFFDDTEQTPLPTVTKSANDGMNWAIISIVLLSATVLSLSAVLLYKRAKA